MPRKRSAQFALMDTAFLSDPKFVRLQRLVPEPMEFAACVGVFWMLLAQARRARSAVIDWDDWAEYSAAIEPLQQARLLTPTGFEEETFDNWAPAYQSPADRARTPAAMPDEDDNAEVRKGTQSTSGYGASNQISSDQVSSSPTKKGEVDIFGQADDPVVMYHTLTQTFPTAKVQEWINRMAKDFDDASVSQAMIVEWHASQTQGDLLGRVNTRLKLMAYERTKQADAELRAAIDPPRSRREQTAEERAAIEERNRQQARAARKDLLAKGIVQPTRPGDEELLGEAVAEADPVREVHTTDAGTALSGGTH